MNTKAEMTLVSDRETLVKRRFNAPPQAVWNAWTKPELVRQWWGLRGATVTECSIDLKVGGRWRWVLEGDGQVVAFSGRFEALDEPRMLRRTEVFEGMPGTDYVVTLHFDPEGDGTLLTSRMVYQSREHRDGHLQSGMEGGMNETYERLDEVLTGQEA